MDFFNIHTHLTRHPESEILSTDVSLFSSITDKEVYLSTGIHPWYLTENESEIQLQTLQETIKDKRVVAIGESGLDKLKGSSIELQQAVFKKEIDLSEKYSLPMVIHCVKAFNELLQLKQSTKPHQPWIIHGFRGKEALAKDLIRHECYLSFGANYQEEALRIIPIEKLFIESDEAETPIEDIYFCIARTRNIPVEELAESIKKNVERVFFKH